MVPKLVALIVYGILMSIAYFGDNLVNSIEPRYYALRGISDSTLHCLVSVLTWVLVYYHSGSKCYVLPHLGLECLLAGVVGSIVDVDHFIVARTFSVQSAITHVSISRPFLHCTSLWIIITWLLSLFHHNLAILIFTSVVSHHIRDASRRGLWFYPLFSTPPLPTVFYLSLMLLLPVISSQCLRPFLNKNHSKDIFLV
uniref:Transmembrane protein 267 n=1 Tax=Cacopsylla melanoneura TaxID=428564 RepID=A0A8D8M3C8_9HEMI